MDALSPLSLDLARRLIALERKHEGASEGDENGSDRDHAVSAVRVCEKLRSVLTTFAGAAGFRALLSRSLTLAKQRTPSLAQVKVREDDSLTGIEGPGARASAKGAGAGGEILVAQLLDLLTVFIGEPLMLRLVQDAWPNAPAFDSRTEDTTP